MGRLAEAPASRVVFRAMSLHTTIGRGARRREGHPYPSVWLLLLICGIPARAQEVAFSIRESLENAAVQLHAGEAEAALHALAHVAEAEPDNPWLWFYRGSAYLILQQPYRAMDAFDRSLAILQKLNHPDRTLENLVRAARDRARRQVFQVSLTLGPAYDSNVSFLGSGAATLGLLAGKEDGKFLARTRIDFSPIEDGRNSLTLGLHAAHSWYFQIDEFDDQEYGGYVRYSRRLSNQWRGEVQYDYEYTLLDHKGFLSGNGATCALRYTWSPGTTWISPLESALFYRIDVRDYRYPVREAFNHDGLTHGVGMQQVWQVRPVPNWIWRVTTGYRFDYVWTEGTEFDRRNNNLHAGIQIPLIRPGSPDKYLILPDKEMTLRFDADWQSTRYRNVSLEDRDRDRRRDRITYLSLGVSQLLRDNPKEGRLVLHVVSEWTNAESNVETRGRIHPFTYEKFVCGILLQWSW